MIIKRCLDKVITFFEGDTHAITLPSEEAQRDDEENMVSRLLDKRAILLLVTGRIVGCIQWHGQQCGSCAHSAYKEWGGE